jgi:NADPH:quinone reductase-like Zn-dependent oxidoreductase
MKAAWFERFGAAADVLKVGSLSDPTPGRGEVLVRLKTSGVNPSDVKKRAGSFPNLLDDGRVVPHSDGAGCIEAVGKDVSADRVGERVWVYQAQFARRFGTAAEFVALDSRRAVVLPDEASFETGACLGIPAMTAHRCVFADGPVDGKTVLVTGGAGRVGFYAIQWASQAGARVIATAGNAADSEACTAVGADCTVNHRKSAWSSAVLEANGGQPVDRVIDVEFGANLPEVLKLIRTGGVIATYSSTQNPQPQLPFFQMMYLDLTVRLVIVYAMPEAAKQHAIADIDAALREERLVHRVAHVVPLEDIARSHELIETGGFRGCVVVSIPLVAE